MFKSCIALIHNKVTSQNPMLLGGWQTCGVDVDLLHPQPQGLHIYIAVQTYINRVVAKCLSMII